MCSESEFLIVILFLISDGDIFEKILQIAETTDKFDVVTAKVITAVYYENHLGISAHSHPTIMELMRRFKVFEGENYCLTLPIQLRMSKSIGSTMHKMLVESLKKSTFAANLQIDGSDDISTK